MSENEKILNQEEFEDLLEQVYQTEDYKTVLKWLLEDRKKVAESAIEYCKKYQGQTKHLTKDFIIDRLLNL